MRVPRNGSVTRRSVCRMLGEGLAASALGAWAAPALTWRRQGSGLVIRGGTVANADGTRRADVYIEGERIVQIAASITSPAGARVIDARGKLVLPGGIDPHTHLQPAFVDDLTSGSRAALAGGLTTLGTFSAPRREETAEAALDRMTTLIQQQAIADFILHTNAGTPRAEFLPALAQLVARGQPSIKVFMVGADFGASLGAFVQLLEAARDAGVVTLVHCEDGALLAAAVRRLTAEGRTSLANYGESRPVVAEVVATQQAAALCESTKAPMHVVHLSSARALDACRDARRQGLPFTVETRPLYLHLTDEMMRRPDAPLYVGQPPLRSRDDVEAMWSGLLDGSIDFLATDHAPWTKEQKLDPSLTIARVRPGVSNLQHMLPMYYSEGVRTRRLPLERFVATTSTNAAKRFGMFPRKGVIAEGSDADVAIWDPELRGTVRGEDDLSNSDYSVYEGTAVTGWPVLTIRRGEIVAAGTNVTGAPGSGRLISRERWTR
ncbi:MAG TPA: amidohydrolase family protein [Gemmatimonadaceae bacterium]